jgi:N-acetylmuramoyl-L-alanine amidase
VTTIAYDRPVKDLIAQLDATGHVTHTAYRKTSVTLHHNGGRLSHEGVLNVWRTREASAHFDSDAVGAIAEFVKVNEYAWAAGNTQGNMSSIHIEMANSTIAPNWGVAEVTWQSAARLAGWLFAKVIGVRPSPANFFVHSHWYSTECAGPFIRSVWNSVMAAAQAAYDYFKGTHPNPLKPEPRSPAKVKGVQLVVRDVVTGVFNKDLGDIVTALKSAQSGSFPRGVNFVQYHCRAVVDGDFGPNSKAALVKVIALLQNRLSNAPTTIKLVSDGDWGDQTQFAWNAFYSGNFNKP